MRVASLHVHPVKGCHRVDVSAAEVRPWGLDDDRRWLVVDAATGDAVTQRKAPTMTAVRPALRDGQLVLRTEGFEDLVVAPPRGGEPVPVTVWSYAGSATPVGAAADDWLSDVLDRKVRLVWMHDPRQRPVEAPHAEAGDTVSFADAYPVLATNLASLDQLNDWMAEAGSDEGPLPMTRFRPNIVISGAGPFAEDGWIGGRLRVGSVTFRVPKPCDRCVVTTTDQETGQRGHEPLRTLARHRQVDQLLLFGVNLIPDAPGSVAVGDPVELVSPHR